MIVQVPIQTGSDSYSESVTLDGRTYVLQFDWNYRMNRWALSIYDADENLLLAGLVLLTEVPVLYGHVVEGQPPGEFVCFDESGQGQNPTKESFGSDVKLLYIEESEFA